MPNIGEFGRKRFLFLDDIPTPYRVTIYNQFQKEYDGEFKVLFAAGKEQGRSWVMPDTHFQYEALPGYSWDPPFQKGNPFPLKLNPSVLNAIREWKPDILAISGYAHPTMLLAMSWAYLNGVPYGVACESSFLSSRTKANFHIKNLLLGKLIRNARFGLASGSKAKEYLTAFGLDARQIFLFPNSPCTAFVRGKTRDILENNSVSQEIKQRYSISENFVLFVGRLIAVKQIPDLINAWAKVTPRLRGTYDLVLCGGGPLYGEIAGLIESSSLERVRLLGDVPYDDVLRIMAMARALVLPSASETWGAVVNEALSAGTPVICSDAVGSSHDMVKQSKTGWQFKSGAVGELAEAISNVLGLPEDEYQRMRNNCKELAEEWGGEAAASNLLRAVMAARV